MRTEQTYVQWVRMFVKWHGLRHPRNMGRPEIESFLAMLANERRVAASTHNQALSALLFLYREVLNIDLPWVDGVQRPRTPKRIPSVLTVDEVTALLAALPPDMALVARLLYGTGVRLMEARRRNLSVRIAGQVMACEASHPAEALRPMCRMRIARQLRPLDCQGRGDAPFGAAPPPT